MSATATRERRRQPEPAHHCHLRTCVPVFTLKAEAGEATYRNRVIMVCMTCGGAWKVIMFDDGKGPEELWLQPGEERDGESFPWSEYEQHVLMA